MSPEDREVAAQAIQQGASLAAGILSLIPGGSVAAPFVGSLGVVVAGVVRVLGDDTPELLTALVAARLAGRISDEDLRGDDEEFLVAVRAMYGNDLAVLLPADRPHIPEPSPVGLRVPLNPFWEPEQ